MLASFVLAHGDNKWRTLPSKAGLKRCGKSCRMRWLNYLRPGIKRGNISEEEEDLIIRLHNLLGNRWSLIAGRIPGRTDNEIKNHWNTHLSKRLLTISDLNNKLNSSTRPLSNGSTYCTSSIVFESNPSSIEPPGMNHDIGFATCSWTGLPDSDIDIEQLLNFEPALSKQEQHGSGSISSELGVEDYGINAGVDGSQEPLNSEAACNANISISSFGHLNSELSGLLSEFDDLEHFLGYQDPGL